MSVSDLTRQKLKIVEIKMNTKINYILFSENKKNEEFGENYVYKFSKSKIHNSNFHSKNVFYKQVHQPFIMKNGLE